MKKLKIKKSKIEKAVDRSSKIEGQSLFRAKNDKK